MNFTPRVPLPPGVQVERLYDVKTIDNGTSELSFFTPNASGVKTDNNYTQNPLPGNFNYVLLGISLNLTLAGIREAANVDPIKVLNNLKDAVITLSTNEGRDQNFIHPLKDYLNLTGIQPAITSAASDDALSSLVVVQSTGMRQTDNLFYMKKQESFTLKVNFNNSVWPTTAQWTTAAQGRFGIQAEIWVAKMSDAELANYQQRIATAS